MSVIPALIPSYPASREVYLSYTKWLSFPWESDGISKWQILSKQTRATTFQTCWSSYSEKKKIKKGKSLVQVEEVVFAITCMPGIPVSPFSPLIPGGPLD